MKTLEEQTAEVLVLDDKCRAAKKAYQISYDLIPAGTSFVAQDKHPSVVAMEKDRGLWETRIWERNQDAHVMASLLRQWQARCESQIKPVIANYESVLRMEKQKNTAHQQRLEESKSKRVKRLEAEISQLFIELGEEKILSAKLRRRVSELESRLEITHEYTEDGRREIPPEERDEHPDGIMCRDATIQLQDEIIDKLMLSVKRMWEALDSASEVAHQLREAIGHLLWAKVLTNGDSIHQEMEKYLQIFQNYVDIINKQAIADDSPTEAGEG